MPATKSAEFRTSAPVLSSRNRRYARGCRAGECSVGRPSFRSDGAGSVAGRTSCYGAGALISSYSDGQRGVTGRAPSAWPATVRPDSSDSLAQQDIGSESTLLKEYGLGSSTKVTTGDPDAQDAGLGNSPYSVSNPPVNSPIRWIR